MITSNDRRRREVSMFFMLVFFAGVAISEAGFLHSNEGYGLRYPGARIGNLRSPVISHLITPGALNYGLKKQAAGPVFNNAPLLSPITFGSVLAGNGPAFNSHLAHLALLNSAVSINQPLTQQFFRTPISSAFVSSVPFQHAAISPVAVNPATIGNSALAPVQLNSEIKAGNTVVDHVKVVHEEVPEKSVSYSVSAKDYQFLKRHKIEGKDSPYNPVPGFEFAMPNPKHHNTHSHHDSNTASNRPSPLVANIKRSIPNYEIQHGYNGLNIGVNVPMPHVTKHIYFHVPPPDFEEPSVPISLPAPKTTYNILFIKAPSQEQNNHAYLQKLLQARQAQIEDKTLIYVLSKKEEPPQPVVLPPQPVSSPEVFFVNYKSRPGELIEINNEIVDQTLLENISPVLDRKRSADKDKCKKN